MAKRAVEEYVVRYADRLPSADPLVGERPLPLRRRSGEDRKTGCLEERGHAASIGEAIEASRLQRGQNEASYQPGQEQLGDKERERSAQARKEPPQILAGLSQGSRPPPES